MKLKDCCNLIRSKNAGPFSLTIDVMVASPAYYRQVKASGALNKRKISELFACAETEVAIFFCDHIDSIKISFPRRPVQGDLLDTDILGGQQYIPLLDLDISERQDASAE